MKHLIPFRIYEAQTTSGLTKRQEEFLNRYTRGTWSVNPSTGLVDIDGYFDCSGSRIKNFMGIQFGEVTRSFDCESNLLTSLEGSPRSVGGTFRCNNNSITSLEGSPQTVGRDFLCSKNSLSSIKVAPKKFGEDFLCSQVLWQAPVLALRVFAPLREYGIGGRGFGLWGARGYDRRIQPTWEPELGVGW